jgi:hypothetical protein
MTDLNAYYSVIYVKRHQTGQIWSVSLAFELVEGYSLYQSNIFI